MRYLLIYNPKSGGIRLFNPRKKLLNFLKCNQVTFKLLDLASFSYDLKAYLGSINWCYFDRILIAGGDGTLNRVVAILVKLNIKKPLAFFPIGSFNGFAKILHYPWSRTKIMHKIVREPIVKVPYGTINNKLFLIFTCFGNIADISTKAEKFFKSKLGFISYILSSIKYASAIKKRQITIKAGKLKKNIKAHSIMIFLRKAKNVFIPIKVKNKNKNHHFTVFYFINSNFWQLFCDLLRIYLFRMKPKYVRYFTCDKLEFTGNFTGQMHVDGEVINDESRHYKVGVAGELEFAA